jgi:hypothetical protein
MIRLPLFAAFAALIAVAGCAAPDQQAGNDAYRAPVYRTGSNLPAGRESGEAPKELSAGERKTIEDLQNRPRTPVGPVTK